jgi:hypothetical protein
VEEVRKIMTNFTQDSGCSGRDSENLPVEIRKEKFPNMILESYLYFSQIGGF